jgi:hypothetical protein
MFDRTFVTTSEAPRYPQTVHEHRAPTDESIRTLREMERKIEENVYATLALDNIVKGTVVVRHDRLDLRYVVDVSLSINGHQITRHELGRYSHLDHITYDDLLKKLRRDIANMIADELIIDNHESVLTLLGVRRVEARG